jgi:hypothetical protein
MEIIPDSYGKLFVNSASPIVMVFYLFSIHMFKCSSSGVDKLANLIKQNGWTEEAGSLTVWPAAADRKKFEECLPHFLSTRTLEQSFYTKDIVPSEYLLQCVFIKIAY